MKIKDIDTNDKTWLKISDFDNFFNIYTDKKNNLIYNLNSTLYLNVDESLVLTYVITHDMHWPLISYKIYSTTHLFWLLLKLNNILTKDIFKLRLAGEKIKYLDTLKLESLINTICED